MINVLNNYYQDEYKKYNYISFSKENNFETELSIILNFLETRFESKIDEYWVPAENLLEKVCLFISFENQEELESEYSDLELALYESTKDFLEKSEYFEMVALL